ncbi:MAG: hypothetical protein KF846_00035 [Cyclobacteriaceae bacterium]|nr:hypothetical protein [Cyclobacteriaceae bacterium]
MESEKVKNYVIEQAKFFLTKAGEFYPFGVVIRIGGELVPLGVHLDNDHPTSQEVIDVLENAIVKKMRDNEISIAGIGADVFYNHGNSEEKKTAIQVRVLHSDGVSVDYFLPYEKSGDEIIYEMPIVDKGTLNLR